MIAGQAQVAVGAVVMLTAAVQRHDRRQWRQQERKREKERKVWVRVQLGLSLIHI